MPFDPITESDRLLREMPVLSDKIQASTGIEATAVAALLTEVLRFMDLASAGDRRLTPSIIVDLAWHEFILCTRLYTDFCQRQWGRYLHHHPGGEETENREGFRRTHYYYEKTFGIQPPTRFWGDPLVKIADASDCGI